MNIRPYSLSLIMFLSCLTANVIAAPSFAPASQSSVDKALDMSQLKSSPKIGSSVLKALDSAEKVKVVVAFNVPFNGLRKGKEKLHEWNRSVQAKRDEIFKSRVGKELKVLREFESVNIIEISVSAKALNGLIHNPSIIRVDLPEPTQAVLAQAGALVNIGQAHNLSQGQGSGGTIAVLDTGIRATHSDFGNRVVGERCFCTDGCCPNEQDTQVGAGSAADGHGHGTHVSGIAAGNGSSSPAVGGAPGADISALKVLADNGSGDLGDITVALDWIINNPGNVNSINISIGSFTLFNGNCDTATAWTIGLATAIDTLRANRIATVVAAGNNGSVTQMTAPACIANAISVGNTYDAALGGLTWNGVPCTDFTTQADQVTCSSNRNVNTDIHAPGAIIRSSGRACDTCVADMSGTSMASPLVAGCAGMIMTDFNTLTVDQLENVLEASPTVIFDAGSNTNIPRLDCEDAYNRADILTQVPPPPATPDLAWMIPVISLILF